MKLKTIVEQIMNEQDLTPEQNKGLKYLYVVFRDVLKDVTGEALHSKITKQNFMQWFREQYNPPSNFPADRRVKIKKGLKSLEVELPDELIKVLPKIRKKIEIVFSVFGNSNAEFNSYQGIKVELVINVEKMLTDFDTYKISLQHEVQHAVDSGTGEDENEQNILVKWMDYQLHPGELKAHAKQHAYQYLKKFPNDNQLDFDKFKAEFYNKGNAKITNYVNFGENSERLRKSYSLTDEQYKKMVDGYKEFVVALKRSFLYFKQK
jgi:hypothetical protein